jgi:hypothetical protein
MAEVLVLCSALFGAGTLLGFAVARLRADRQREGLDEELRGWALCERAVHAELSQQDRVAVLRRVRTRVPPRLRLQHEKAVVEAEERRLSSVTG